MNYKIALIRGDGIGPEVAVSYTTSPSPRDRG